MASDVTMPALMTLPNVDIIAAGTWALSTGEATFTTDDLASAVEASQCPAVGPPIIKLGHVDPRFDGEPAVGKVANLALTASGNKITGDLSGMPGWLGVVLSSAYPNRSIEGSWDFVCQIGHTHPFVLTGLALLGVSAPGVGVLGSLDDIAALYGVAAGAKGEGDPWTMKGDQMTSPIMAQGVTTEDVRRAYYAAPSTSYSTWITEMQLDPSQLIVADEATNCVYRVPVDVAGGEVTFGDPVEVAVEYVDVPAKTEAASAPDAERIAVRYESAAASREGITESGTLKPDRPEPPAFASTDTEVVPVADETATEQHTDPEPPEPDSPEPEHETEPAPATAGAPMKTGGSDVDFTDEQTTSLRASLGLKDDDELTAEALESGVGRLKAKADKAMAGQRVELPKGAIAVEQEAWDNLQASVKKGEEYRRRQEVKDRDTVIEAAVKAGKFSPARKQHWVRLWDADPDGTRQVLASLQKNVVPLDDIGTSGGAEDDLLDEEYKSLFPPGSAGSR